MNARKCTSFKKYFTSIGSRILTPKVLGWQEKKVSSFALLLHHVFKPFCDILLLTMRNKVLGSLLLYKSLINILALRESVCITKKVV